jgi:hypothetical protein
MSFSDPILEFQLTDCGRDRTQKFSCALWEDMVNTASRMESHGEITVKGKGKIKAWHLFAKKEERSLSHA